MQDDYINPAHAFGRVEGKLDKIVDQVGQMGMKVAEYGVRLTHLETAVGEQKVAEYGTRLAQLESAVTTKIREDDADTKQKVTLRGALTVGIVTVLLSAVGTWVVQLLTPPP